MKLWMKVTDDIYELPEVIADSAHELAQKLGIKDNAIYRSLSIKGEESHFKKVEIDYDETEETEETDGRQ